MSEIIINQSLVTNENRNELMLLCPFGAFEVEKDGSLAVGAGCKMCRLCVKKRGDVFIYSEGVKKSGKIDKSLWRGIAVAAEISGDKVHPVSLELIGKARVLADKTSQKVFAFLAGKDVEKYASVLGKHGADTIYIYDDEALEYFRIEPFTSALEDFINVVKPSVVLVGGTPSGRALAPRAAARFRTGLTADCTVLDIKENTDLEQIRPAFGGNIMAHINTPDHRPQFATVRYKIFPLPECCESRKFDVVKRDLPPEKYVSAIEILNLAAKPHEISLEDAETIVVAGRGVKKIEDMTLIRTLADALNAQIAGTRCIIESNWLDHRRQIGLSGRTVAPKLIICCGVSGSVQFAAGMKGSEKIIAINTDPDAAIFNIAHICIKGDLYEVIPALLESIREKGVILK